MLAALAQLQKMAIASRRRSWAAAGKLGTLQASLTTSEPPKPVRYIANTTFAPDHIGGNAKVRAGGQDVHRRQRGRRDRRRQRGRRDPRLREAATRMSAPTAQLPTQTLADGEFFRRLDEAEPLLQRRGGHALHIPAASTDADSIVNFRRSDVFATGDIFRMSALPKIDLEKGGSIQGVLAG